MDKKKEIEVLQSLKGDTYFAQLFSDSDIDEMCENIKKDFAIECGISLFENSVAVRKAKSAKESLETKIMSLDSEKEEMVNFLIIQAEKWSADDLRVKAIKMVGEKEYLKRKIEMGFSLWECDKQLLIEILK